MGSVFRRAAARRGTPADWLAVGLANPGDRYAGTRHNLGAEVIERWAAALGCELRADRSQRARVGQAAAADKRVTLACPTTFMNESGRSVGVLVKRHGITDPARLVVVHDELDLAPGTVRLKSGGGTAGHNGLASVSSQLGTADFVRVRIGVGKPPRPQAGAKWVLAPPSGAERELLDDAVERAVAGLGLLVADGLEAAMNATNARPASGLTAKQ